MRRGITVNRRKKCSLEPEFNTINLISMRGGGSGLALLKFAMQRNTAPREILEFVTGKGRHLYCFDGKFSGCLFWQLMFLAIFEGESIIEKGSVDSVHKHITQCRELSGEVQEQVLYPPVPGVFYTMS